MPLRDMILGKRAPESGFTPLTQEHRKRQELFAAYWRYYRGHHRRNLKVDAGKHDDNVTLNLSKRVVNKGVQFLFGKPLVFETAEGTERTAEEQYLDKVWGIEEEKSTLLQLIALNGGVTGQAVVRLYAPEQGVSEPLPRIVNIDPAILDVVTNPDDIEDIKSYRLVWKSEDTWKRHRVDVQDNDTWVVTEEIARPNSADWQIIDEILWAYPFAPIITCQNLPIPNEFWGISDLEEADINDAINFTASNIARILKFHAHPKTIGKGFSAEQLQNTAVEQFWTIPDPEADVFNLEMQSDLAAAYNYLQELKQTYSKVTNVPDLDPAVVNVGALSGFALRILYGDLEEVTRVKRNTYGMLLSEINSRLLALGNVAAYNTMPVKSVWKDPLPENALEDAQTLEIDRRNGLSEETYLERRGYNVEREKERKEQEQEQQQNIGEFLLGQFNRGQMNGKPLFGQQQDSRQQRQMERGR